jgi:hypothetical protein
VFWKPPEPPLWAESKAGLWVRMGRSRSIGQA